MFRTTPQVAANQIANTSANIHTYSYIIVISMYSTLGRWRRGGWKRTLSVV